MHTNVNPLQAVYLGRRDMGLFPRQGFAVYGYVINRETTAEFYAATDAEAVDYFKRTSPAHANRLTKLQGGKVSEILRKARAA